MPDTPFSVDPNDDGVTVTVTCLYCGVSCELPVTESDDDLLVPFEHDRHCPLRSLIDWTQQN